jgi:NAD(P)H dehydrogenase (quinone)
MNTLIVHAHPEPASFTAALKDQARDTLLALGHELVVSDLYAEGFNPVAGRHDFETVADASRLHYQQEQLHAAQGGGFAADLRREQQRVAEADLFLFTYPLWWGGMPAILKGWFDRVMAYGFAYADCQRFDTGFFKGRHAMVALSTGGTPERFSPGGVYGPIEQLLYPHQRTMLEYLGLQVAPPFVAYAAPRVGQAAREDCLRQWSLTLKDWVAGIEPAARAATPGFAHVRGSATHWASTN